MTSPTAILLTVDGEDFPVDFADITGEQVLHLRNVLGVSPVNLTQKVVAGTAELPEVAALMALSLEHRDQPADTRWLLRHLRLDSAVSVTYDPGEDLQV